MIDELKEYVLTHKLEEKRTDKICYCEAECECRDCGECEYNERRDEE